MYRQCRQMYKIVGTFHYEYRLQTVFTLAYTGCQFLLNDSKLYPPKYQIFKKIRVYTCSRFKKISLVIE